MLKFNQISAWQVTLLAMLVCAAFMMPNLAFADTPEFLEQACDKVWQVWDYGKTAVYVIAGIGILVMAVFAFFGRFKWSHLFALGGGVLLVATAAELIEWLGGRGGDLSCNG